MNCSSIIVIFLLDFQCYPLLAVFYPETTPLFPSPHRGGYRSRMVEVVCVGDFSDDSESVISQ